MRSILHPIVRAAIYARRSQAKQEASLEVQIEEARRYIEKKGWVLDEAHIFVDGEEGSASRAEFMRRPALISMLNAAEARAFDVIVCRDETRLGGDVNRTCLLIQDILDAGCRLHYYFTDEEVRLDGAMQKIMVSLRNFASELEREKISQRTRENHLVKARKGFVVGGACFGYRTKEVRTGERRDHVEYEVDPKEAKVVRQVFEMCADGQGLKTIAKALNARGIPSPRAGSRGTGSWAPSTIQPMLRRVRYLGQLVWGAREKTYQKGTKTRIARPKCDWTIVTDERLRIVSDELWARVQARIGKKKTMGRSSSRGAAPKYMLSGLSRCGVCGGPIQVVNGKASYETIKVYSCAYHRERGSCDNALRRPVTAIDEAVIEAIASSILTEDMILKVTKEVRRRLADRAKQGSSELPELEKQAKKIRAEIARLVEAVATTTKPPAALVSAMSAKEEQLQAIEARMVAMKTAPSVLDLEVRRLEKEASKRLRDLKTTLKRNPTDARAALEKLLEGPLKFTPIETREGRRYRIEGQVSMISIAGVPSGIRPGVHGVHGAGRAKRVRSEVDAVSRRAEERWNSAGASRQAGASPAGFEPA